MINSAAKKRYRLHIYVTVSVMLFIFIQSAMPGEVSGAESNIIVQILADITGWNEEVLSIFVRKAAHFTEFLILGICLSVNMNDLRAKKIAAGEISAHDSARMYWLAAWLIGTAYAMTDEFHQLFVPDRAGSLTDVGIDSAGVAAGVLIYIIFDKQRVQNKTVEKRGTKRVKSVKQNR